MKFSIKTEVFKSMMSRAIKGASCNKLLPITSLIRIKLEGGKLSLTTTDATNYLYILKDKIEGEDFEIVVGIDVLSKLIAKTTCETISLTIKENSLEVKGNGTYEIEIPLDEDGKWIKFPDKTSEFPVGDSVEINLTTIRTILDANKASLAVSMEQPYYTGYYFGDSIVTSDTYKICSTGVKIFDIPVLISSQMMDLLGVMEDEKIKAFVEDNRLVFISDTCTVYGTQLEGVENFNIEAISGLVNSSFTSNCTVDKAEILNLLDRLALFVGVYDKNSIYMTFTKDGIMFNSKKSNGNELIKYIESSDFKDYTCCIDIEMLRSQIASQPEDKINIYYGHEVCIKLTSANITQIVALTEDDREVE